MASRVRVNPMASPGPATRSSCSRAVRISKVNFTWPVRMAAVEVRAALALAEEGGAAIHVGDGREPRKTLHDGWRQLADGIVEAGLAKQAAVGATVLSHRPLLLHGPTFCMHSDICCRCACGPRNRRRLCPAPPSQRTLACRDPAANNGVRGSR